MPQHSSDSPTSSVPIPIPKPDSSSGHDYKEPSRHAQCSRPWSGSPGYESDSPRVEASDVLNGSSRNRDDFVTSTPIKLDKENQKRGNGSMTEEEEVTVWSSAIVQHSTGRKHLREANDVS